MIDTIHRVETPEGVELRLRAAGPLPRAVAWLVDLCVQAALLAAGSALFLPFGDVGLGLLLILQFLVSWFYPVAFELALRGQTPGKRLLGLQVLHEDGTPVGAAASILRNFLRLVDLLPAAYLLGLVTSCADASFRRVGDLAAGTLVVYAPQAFGPTVHLPRVAAPLAPPIALSADERAAVIAFAERAPQLTAERASELAAIPTPLLSGAEPRAELERMAAYLVGRGA